MSDEELKDVIDDLRMAANLLESNEEEIGSAKERRIRIHASIVLSEVSRIGQDRHTVAEVTPIETDFDIDVGPDVPRVVTFVSHLPPSLDVNHGFPAEDFTMEHPPEPVPEPLQFDIDDEEFGGAQLECSVGVCPGDFELDEETLDQLVEAWAEFEPHTPHTEDDDE